MSCDDRIEKLSALLDGELAAAELAELTAHIAACPDCARRLAELGALRAALADAVPEEAVSADFTARIEAVLAAQAALIAPQTSARVLVFKPRRPILGAFVTGAAAASIAASLMFTSLQPPKNIADLAAVRDAALRGSAMLSAAEVPAEAPSVPGFRLASARSDVVAGHAAEVLAYVAPDYASAADAAAADAAAARITLCIWKANGEAAHGPREGSYRGMNIVYWNDGSEEYWAAANLPVEKIEAFGQLVRSAPS